MTNYQSVAVTRENTLRGGGLMVFVKDNISFTKEVLKVDVNDLIQLNLRLDNLTLCLLVSYRQPSSSKIKFIDELKDLLKKLENLENVVFVGDINIDILKMGYDKPDKLSIEKYETMLATKGFEPKINSPTREECTAGHFVESCIDHIFVRSPNLNTEGLTWKKKISDHYFTLLIFTDSKEAPNENDQYDFVKYNDIEIVNHLNKIDWNYLNLISDATTMYDEITNRISEVYNKFKVKEIKKKRTPKTPWITNDLLQLIDYKNDLWDQITSNKRNNYTNPKLLEEYRSAKNKLCKLIIKAKQNYYQKIITDSKNDNKVIWNSVNEIISGKSRPKLDEQLNRTFKSKSNAETRNLFNNNFANQVGRLKLSYKRRNDYFQSKINGKSKTLKKSVSETMFVSEASVNEIIDIIKEMKMTHSSGFDGFQLKHIKESVNNSSVFISTLINKIVESEVWPEKLKIQVIRPIFKKGVKTDLDNYRPISLLSVIDKVIEKYFNNKIRNFLEKHNVITKKQFGFQKKHSTTDVLKIVNDVVSSALDQGKFVGTILIDLQKAFDTVDHDILLKKCERIGLRGKIHNILKNYLSHRKACTRINNSCSNFCDVSCGVPQGSILGPLLFIIYVNDIVDIVENAHIFLFADDIVIMAINQDYDCMVKNLQQDFNSINDWFIENEVFISETKTVNLTIKTPHMKQMDQKSVYMHTERCSGNCSSTCIAVNKSKKAKYLGLIIEEDWSLKNHIDELLLKLRQILPKLYHLRNVLSTHNKKMLYSAWIESHLRYAIEIFGFVSHYLIDRLQSTQNKIIKVFFNNYEHLKTNERYKVLKILKFTQLRDLIVIKNNFFEQRFLHKDFNKINYLRTHSVRYHIPKWNNEHGKRHRRYYVPDIFNTLSEDLLKINSFSSLKRELIKYYFK